MDAVADLRSVLERKNDSRKRIRQAQVETSEKSARARLRQEFQRKLQVLRDSQQVELAELSEKWRRAHAKAEIRDRSADECNEATVALLGIPKSRLEQNGDRNVEQCDNHYAALVKRMLARQKAELDWLKRAFQEELTLLAEEYDILNERIEDQFKIETTEVAAKLINAVHANVDNDDERQRMIKTLSPRRQKRDAFMRAGSPMRTPVRRRKRIVPNTV